MSYLMVCKKIDPSEPNKFSGVYDIPSTNEDGTIQFYIHIINRKLKSIIREHIADIKYIKRTTALLRLCR